MPLLDDFFLWGISGHVAELLYAAFETISGEKPNIVARPDEELARLVDLHAFELVTARKNQPAIDHRSPRTAGAELRRIFAVFIGPEGSFGVQTVRSRADPIRITRIRDEILPFTKEHVRESRLTILG